jgi:hypothetical protein
VIEAKIQDGETTETFMISTALLKQHAPKLFSFFRAQFNSTSKPNEVSITTFTALVHRLGDQDDNSLLDEPLYVPGVFEGWGDIMPLIKVYEFAIKYEICGLKADVIPRLSRCIEQPDSAPPKILPLHPVDQVRVTEAVDYVYHNGLYLLRPVLVDMFCAVDLARATDLWKCLIDGLPKKFLVDVLVKERGMKAHEDCKTEAAKSVRRRHGGGETSARKRKRMDESWDGGREGGKELAG